MKSISLAFQVLALAIGLHKHPICSCDAVLISDGPILPNADLLVEQFAQNETRRNNFCDIQEKFHAGEVDLASAFKGRKINFAIARDSSVVNFLEDGSIDPSDPGIMIELLDEVASRGGFDWVDSFAYEEAPMTGKSWTELLTWSISTYDMSINWWYSTPERISLG